MIITDIRPNKKALKNRKRVGRGPGSGWGKTAGRGANGQKSRSGYSRRFGFEGGQMPLVRRIPKRGFTNYPFKKEYQIVNLNDLIRVDEDEITLEAMKKAGLIKKENALVKVLSNGEIEKAVTVYAHKFSEQAKKKIEDKGGKAIIVSLKNNKE
jgi:large subunit ribosomal protein L15